MGNYLPSFPHLIVSHTSYPLCTLLRSEEQTYGEAPWAEKLHSLQRTHQLHHFQFLPGLLDKLFPTLAAHLLWRHAVISFKGLSLSFKITPSLLDPRAGCQ